MHIVMTQNQNMKGMKILCDSIDRLKRSKKVLLDLNIDRDAMMTRIMLKIGQSSEAILNKHRLSLLFLVATLKSQGLLSPAGSENTILYYA